MKIRIALTLESVKKQKIAIDSKKKKGLFLWIGGYGVILRIIGYHYRRGFIADYCYNTKNHWIKDLFIAVKNKKGIIHITKFI